MDDETQIREMEKDMARDAEEIAMLKGRIAELEEQLRKAKAEILRLHRMVRGAI